MKHSQRIKLLLCIILAGTMFVPFTAQTVQATRVNENLSPYRLSWQDDFSDSSLDSRWSWVREEPSLWSLTASPGYMQITSSGSLFQSANDQKNVLLTPAPSGDFRITTRVITTPIENYHGACLYVYQDDDNYIEVTRIYSDGPMVGIRAEVSGVTWSYYVSVTSDEILLRIVKEADTYYAWYSEDNGTTWIYIDQYNNSFSNIHVGIGVRMGPGTTPLTADFDWINLERIIYNTTWVDSFDSPDLDSHWSWVRENPELWSLTAEPGMIRIIASGNIYQALNDQTNLLLTNAPPGDYRIHARVLVSPTVSYHGATLYAYQDDDNYIEVASVYNDGPSIYIRKEESGIVDTIYVPATTNDVRFHLTKDGNTYYAWFSEDNGVTWNYVGQQSISLTNAKVGISARTGPTETPVTADWGFFLIENYMEKMFIPLVAKK